MKIFLASWVSFIAGLMLDSSFDLCNAQYKAYQKGYANGALMLLDRLEKELDKQENQKSDQHYKTI